MFFNYCPKVLRNLYFNHICNNLFAFWASFVKTFFWEEKPTAVAAIEISTGGEGDVEPPACQVIAPAGAGWVGAGQGVPVERLAVASHSK